MLGMEANGMLPPSLLTNPAKNRLIPLVFQDKIFIGQVVSPIPGQVGRPGRFLVPQCLRLPPGGGGIRRHAPVPSCIPEFFWTPCWSTAWFIPLWRWSRESTGS